jgi:hypothetical protein
MQLVKWFFACILCLVAAAVQAVPVLIWTAEVNQRGAANLTRQLQNTVLVAPTDQARQLTPTQAYGGQAWEWSESRFKSAGQQPLTHLDEGQRWVARSQLVFPASNTSGAAFSAENGPGLYLLWPVHRLDYVHMSYRVNQGMWHTLSAGDRIPMRKWE